MLSPLSFHLYSSLPNLQLFAPLFRYPSSHWHSYEPCMLTHFWPVPLQSWFPCLHSSTSEAKYSVSRFVFLCSKDYELNGFQETNLKPFNLVFKMKKKKRKKERQKEIPVRILSFLYHFVKRVSSVHQKVKCYFSVPLRVNKGLIRHMIITCKSQCWFHIKSIKVHVLVTTNEAMKDSFWHTGYIWNEPRR